MAQRVTDDRGNEAGPGWSGPSEPQSHTEHLAALDATLFRKACDPYELVLELDAGELRVRPPRETADLREDD